MIRKSLGFLMAALLLVSSSWAVSAEPSNDSWVSIVGVIGTVTTNHLTVSSPPGVAQSIATDSSTVVTRNNQPSAAGLLQVGDSVKVLAQTKLNAEPLAVRVTAVGAVQTNTIAGQMLGADWSKRSITVQTDSGKKEEVRISTRTQLFNVNERRVEWWQAFAGLYKNGDRIQAVGTRDPQGRLSAQQIHVVGQLPVVSTKRQFIYGDVLKVNNAQHRFAIQAANRVWVVTFDNKTAFDAGNGANVLVVGTKINAWLVIPSTGNAVAERIARTGAQTGWSRLQQMQKQFTSILATV